MKIGFVVNQIETEEGWYDTTLLSSTAAQMGHSVFIISLGGLAYYENGHMGANAVLAPSKKFKLLEDYLKHIQGPEAEKVQITSKDLDVLYLSQWLYWHTNF